MVTDSQAEAARETLNKIVYSVYASESEQEQNGSEQDNSEEQPAEQLVQEDPHPNVNDVAKSITERSGTDQENLALWKRVFKTDERFTKQFTQNSGGTSITRIVSGYLTEKHHVIKTRLWYVRNGERGEEIPFGCIQYVYGSKYGPIRDGEATKKSLTVATKKVLFSLGFSADIFMGLYDNPEYRQKNKEEFALKNASDNAEDAARFRQEPDDKLTRVANTLATGVSANELTAVFASIVREVEVHRKDAEAKGDNPVEANTPVMVLTRTGERQNSQPRISTLTCRLISLSMKAKGISDPEGSLEEKQAISGHKNSRQTAIYDRKVKVVPVVGGQKN